MSITQSQIHTYTHSFKKETLLEAKIFKYYLKGEVNGQNYPHYQLKF